MPYVGVLLRSDHALLAPVHRELTLLAGTLPLTVLGGVLSFIKAPAFETQSMRTQCEGPP